MDLTKVRQPCFKNDFQANLFKASKRKISFFQFYMNQSHDTLPIAPLLDATHATLQTPMANHTLQRTFGTPIEALFGPEIK